MSKQLVSIKSLPAGQGVLLEMERFSRSYRRVLTVEQWEMQPGGIKLAISLTVDSMANATPRSNILKNAELFHPPMALKKVRGVFFALVYRSSRQCYEMAYKASFMKDGISTTKHFYIGSLGLNNEQMGSSATPERFLLAYKTACAFRKAYEVSQNKNQEFRPQMRHWNNWLLK